MDGPALLVVLLYLLLPVFAASDEDGLTLRVGQGLLRGHLLVSRKGRQFRAFQGVPYAKPPLGELRFKAPEPPEPWVGVRNATRYSDICTQRSIFAKQVNVAGSEDCLYLNIFTPSQETLKKLDQLLDVMVWFHGGGFVSGAGSFYAPNFLLDHDIVLVTLNYRLGPLGFLSTGDAQAPGNFGLKDQVTALRWVKENMAVFGGDPARITAFGESAGGASVHFHTISPLSVGLMARGISQSGTALCPWALTSLNHSVAQTRKLAKLLDCPPTDPLPCLRTKDAVEIIATDRHFMEWDVDPLIPFKPVVEPKEADGAFLPADPLELILDKSQKKIPWLTGINSADGALKAAPIYEHSELVKELNEQFERVAPITLMYGQCGDVLEVTQRIRDFYFQEQPISNETLKHVVDMYTDWFFLSAAHAAVRAHLLSSDPEEAPLYYYYFAYRGQRSYSEVFGDPTRDFGVCHADELLYMFPSSRVFGNFTPSQEEHDMTDLLIRLWVNFAHTGNPTPEGEKIHWLKTTSPYKPEYLHIASPYDVHMKQGLLVERAEFWSSLPLTATQYPQLISLHDEL